MLDKKLQHIISEFVCMCICVVVYRQRNEDKKAAKPSIVSNVELATLPDIPRGNFIQSNALYAPTLQYDLDDLPKIHREQITLAKFLGSGAFGEVKKKSSTILDTKFRIHLQ